MKDLLKATIITGFAFGLNLLINLVRSKAVAVYLGPEGLAAFAQVNAFITLVITITSMGLAAAIVRYIADYKATQRLGDLKTLIATTFIFSLGVSGVATVILLLLTPQVAQFIYAAPMLFGVVALSLLNIPISVVTNLGVSLLQGFKEIKADAKLSVASSVVAIGMTVGLLIPFGLMGAVVGSLAANYLTSFVFFFFLMRIINRNVGTSLSRRVFTSSHKYFSMNSMRPLTGIAIASLVGGGMTNLGDILIRTHLIDNFGLAIAGGIQPALSLSAQYTGVLSGAVGTYALPRLTELINDRPAFKKEFNYYIRLLLLLVTPAAGLLALAAKYIIPLLYTDKFLIAAPLVPIQSLSDIMKFVGVGLGCAILCLGRGKILLMLGVVLPVVYYGSYVLLSHVMGYAAIPVASLIAQTVCALITYLILTRSFDIHLSTGNKVLITSSLAVGGVIAFSVSRYDAVIGISIGALALAAWIMGNITPKEWSAARNLIQARIKR